MLVERSQSLTVWSREEVAAKSPVKSNRAFEISWVCAVMVEVHRPEVVSWVYIVGV